MALAERALGGLAHHREDLGQDLLERLVPLLALLERADPGLPFGDPRAQLIGVLPLHPALELVDIVDVGAQALDLAIVLGAENLARDKGK